MFSEPSRTQFDLNFRAFGIPVRVHPLFWVVAAVLGWSDEAPDRLLIWIPAVFVSILVHELGHAFCARRFGNQPWIVLHGFGGLAAYHERWSTSVWQRLAISFCGPLAGFLLAAAILLLTLGFGSPQGDVLRLLLDCLLLINIFWGVLNLFPIWPLDGGKISFYLLHWLSPSRGPGVARCLSAVSAGLLAVTAGMSGLFITAVFFGILAVQSLQGWGRYR